MGLRETTGSELMKLIGVGPWSSAPGFLTDLPDDRQPGPRQFEQPCYTPSPCPASAGILCYRQVHRANHPLDEALQEARGTQVESYLGHAEVWVDRRAAPNTPEARIAVETFIADEHKFIDMQRSTFLHGKEYSFIDRR
jgi:hypothetical protein